MVHRGQDAEVAVGDRDASMLEPALLCPPRGPARLALLNLGLVELLEVRLDDRAVEKKPWMCEFFGMIGGAAAR